ncbi:MAG: aldo/keto reductase [Rhodospirillaceae bacterium]|nr:aldo/keto reductase [Rhodospirillaceae bacterium]MBT5413124.1 aldo/keto reductase [Rhodospirillaceae bacterium]MBT6116718.1 aldo/keto reductase [Rhodospirillaceae bacterium]
MKTDTRTGTVRRRDVLAGLGAAAALAALPGPFSQPAFGESGGILTRPMPATGEQVPAIGMGSWITFNVGADPALRDARAQVLAAFFARGGRMVDSSPMYGTSEEVIGYCLARVPGADALFSATKVWTWLRGDGPEQMAESRRLWGIEGFDLMQIHNLLGWEGHLETLLADRERGRLRYIGITTSHGRRHEDFEGIMASQPIDTVQLTYNIVDREAERRLLPLAAERGLAVIVNRPFKRKALFEAFAGHPLPTWAGEFGAENWAQFFLKFIVSHPAVTCAIPATSRVDHMHENMGALHGPLPDSAMRRRMIDHVESL